METINKNKNLLIFLLIIVLGFILFYFLLHKNVSENVLKTENINYVKIGGQKIKVEVASTPEKQEKGLSGRKKLKENEGMLFVFDKSDQHFFWMKDMNFPIDIIWLDEGLSVIYIKKNVAPKSFPESFGPDKNAKYVLELISNFSEKNNLKEGDGAKFLP